jgi:hypothetical protein
MGLVMEEWGSLDSYLACIRSLFTLLTQLKDYGAFTSFGYEALRKYADGLLKIDKQRYENMSIK